MAIGNRQRQQTQQICKDFLRYCCKGQRMDGISAMRAMDDRWGVRVDYHEMGDALEYLACHDEAIRDGCGPDRIACYVIN